MNTTEIWVTIPNTNEQYSISSIARVMSNYKPLRYGNKKFREKILKPSLSKGYHVVNIHRKPTPIHRLIAEAFIPKIEGRNIINHKNGITTDNRLENLEWVNHSENAIHAFRVLGIKGSAFGKTGKDNPTSVPVTSLEVNGSSINFVSMMEARKYYKISHRTFKSLISGVRFNYKGILKFQYKQTPTLPTQL